MTTATSGVRVESSAEPAVYDLPVPDLSAEALAAVTAEIAETAAEYDRTGETPWKGLDVAYRAGLLTATVGRRYGGPEVGQRDLVRILTAIGEGDASVGLLASNLLMSHAGQAIHPHWPVAYYDDLLRRSLDGPALVNAIRAEPELGAPAAAASRRPPRPARPTAGCCAGTRPTAAAARRWPTTSSGRSPTSRAATPRGPASAT